MEEVRDATFIPTISLLCRSIKPNSTSMDNGEQHLMVKLVLQLAILVKLRLNIPASEQDVEDAVWQLARI